MTEVTGVQNAALSLPWPKARYEPIHASSTRVQVCITVPKGRTGTWVGLCASAGQSGAGPGMYKLSRIIPQMYRNKFAKGCPSFFVCAFIVTCSRRATRFLHFSDGDLCDFSLWCSCPLQRNRQVTDLESCVSPCSPFCPTTSLPASPQLCSQTHTGRRTDR